MSKKVYITYRLGHGLLPGDPLKNKRRLIDIIEDQGYNNYILRREYAKLLDLDARRLGSVPKHMLKTEMFIYD